MYLYIMILEAAHISILKNGWVCTARTQVDMQELIQQLKEPEVRPPAL